MKYEDAFVGQYLAMVGFDNTDHLRTRRVCLREGVVILVDRRGTKCNIWTKNSCRYYRPATPAEIIRAAAEEAGMKYEDVFVGQYVVFDLINGPLRLSLTGPAFSTHKLELRRVVSITDHVAMVSLRDASNYPEVGGVIVGPPLVVPPRYTS